MDDTIVNEGVNTAVEGEPVEETDIQPEIHTLIESFDSFVEMYSENRDLDLTYREGRDTKLDESFSSLIENTEPVVDDDTSVQEIKSLLTELVENTTPVESDVPFTTELEGVGYYADLSIILFVIVILPVYWSYRLVKSVMGMTRYF